VCEGSVCRKTANRATKRSCKNEKRSATKVYDLRTEEYSASKAVRRHGERTDDRGASAEARAIGPANDGQQDGTSRKATEDKRR